MTAYGATLILVPGEGGIEAARDLALQMQDEGKGSVFSFYISFKRNDKFMVDSIVLDQFNNPDNVAAHYEQTGPEIWRDTDGRVTHFVSSMGTTGTIMGVSKYLKGTLWPSLSPYSKLVFPLNHLNVRKMPLN